MIHMLWVALQALLLVILCMVAAIMAAGLAVLIVSVLVSCWREWRNDHAH